MIAMGFSASAISSVLHSDANAESRSSAEAYEVEGSGGMILAEVLKAADGKPFVLRASESGASTIYAELSGKGEGVIIADDADVVWRSIYCELVDSTAALGCK